MGLEGGCKGYYGRKMLEIIGQIIIIIVLVLQIGAHSPLQSKEPKQSTTTTTTTNKQNKQTNKTNKQTKTNKKTKTKIVPSTRDVELAKASSLKKIKKIKSIRSEDWTFTKIRRNNNYISFCFCLSRLSIYGRILRTAVQCVAIFVVRTGCVPVCTRI